MTDAFEKTGNGIFMGIELSEQEVRLRPKGRIEARAVELHGKMFFSIMPNESGPVVFGVLVDNRPVPAFMHEYEGGTNFEEKDLGVNRAYAFTYPAWARMTPGSHSVQILLGKMITTEVPGQNVPQWILESPRYGVVVTEGEEA